jgi:hypothetical protein
LFMDQTGHDPKDYDRKINTKNEVFWQRRRQ